MNTGPTVRLLDGTKREMRTYDWWRGERAPDESADREERLAHLDREREKAGHEVYGGSE